MQQLTGLDASFLYAETKNAPQHIGGLSIWDPSTAPGGVVRFKRIIQTMEERAHLAPYLRQRLYEVPFNADFPFWVKDQSFDAEFHIRHIALPKPGDWRQLCIQVARLNSRALDRSRPLWEIYVIEGLDNVEGVPPGSFAMYSKTHHACIDGRSGTDIGTALCDLTPEIQTIPGAEAWSVDKPPTPMELAAMAFQNNAGKIQNYFQFLRKATPIWAEAYQSIASGKLRAIPDVPRVRFNGVVSPHRIFEGVHFSLDDVRAIKNTAGGTVNDVMLAICSGAMRRYLQEKNELPEMSMVSMCPINVRDPNAGANAGNQVSAMAVALRTDIQDPKERLNAISAETNGAKELTNAMGAKSMVDMANFMPTQLAGLGARVAAEQGWANYTKPIFNTVITNVPGVQVPIFSNGAAHVRTWGTGPCVDGTGLFHSVGSYCGDITIGVSACRTMMPDPSNYADCLRASFDELKDSVLKKGAKSTAKKKAAVKKKAAPKKKATAKKNTAKQDTTAANTDSSTESKPSENN